MKHNTWIPNFKKLKTILAWISCIVPMESKGFAQKVPEPTAQIIAKIFKAPLPKCTLNRVPQSNQYHTVCVGPNLSKIDENGAYEFVADFWVHSPCDVQEPVQKKEGISLSSQMQIFSGLTPVCMLSQTVHLSISRVCGHPLTSQEWVCLSASELKGQSN